VARIQGLRETYPRWGERKLEVLLRGEGWRIGQATVGRTLTRLRARGALREPPLVRTALAQQRRRDHLARRYARRRPDGSVVRAPGDLVQLDTTPITLYAGCQRTLPGVAAHACDGAGRGEPQ